MINSKTQLYCIFGRPAAHSISPVIHNTLFVRYGVNAAYLAFEPSGIKEAVNSMRALNIKGASVTIPFKIEVMPHLDEISKLAQDIGAVNTIINSNGRILGDNTDGFGVLLALEKNGIDVEGKRILILGNGGSARASAFTLADQGARVYICGRTEIKIRDLSNDINRHEKRSDFILIKDLTEKFMGGIDIIINTTPAGMSPDINSSPIDTELLNPKHTVFDIIYAPDTTRLLSAAISAGCGVIRGIDMLIHQAVKQFELWTGIYPDASIIYNAVNDYRRDGK